MVELVQALPRGILVVKAKHATQERLRPQRRCQPLTGDDEETIEIMTMMMTMMMMMMKG